MNKVKISTIERSLLIVTQKTTRDLVELSGLRERMDHLTQEVLLLRVENQNYYKELNILKGELPC
jgi:hypothetical protein